MVLVVGVAEQGCGGGGNDKSQRKWWCVLGGRLGLGFVESDCNSKDTSKRPVALIPNDT